MNNKKKIVITCIIFIGLIVSFALGRLQVIKSFDLIDVPCSSSYLVNRVLIKNKDIEYTKVPSSLINDEMITNENEIIGRYVSANTFINKGSFFFKNQIDDTTEMDDIGYFEIDENESIYELFVKNIDANPAHINCNMYVDLYLTIDKPIIISDLLISGVKICGLYDKDYIDISNNESNRNSLAIISLIVKNDMISLLNKAQLYGKISIVPSNDPYVYRDMFINEKGEIMNYIN